MKYLFINRYFLLFFLFGFFQVHCNAQNFSKSLHLSDDIESLLNSNPEQSLKIAQYLLSKTNTTNKEKAKINFLISKAYLIKGDYSSALNFLYEEKNYKDYLTEIENIKIEISKIAVLREIALDEQSKRILKRLQNQFDDNQLQNKEKKYLEISIAIEKARFFLKENQPAKGISLLNEKDFFSGKEQKNLDELKLDCYTTLGQLYLQKNQIDKAKDYFDKAIGLINDQNEENGYSKIDVLCGLAEVAFRKKEYEKAIVNVDEALGYAKRFDNLFLQMKIMQQQSKIYLALNRLAEYKQTYAKFFEFQDQAEAQEQEFVNTAYNLISDEYDSKYEEENANYVKVVYIASAFLLIVILICIFFWLKKVEAKKGLDQIINYIEITRNNLLDSFSVADKKTEPKKNLILKETEQQILNKLKRFESSKRFLNKDISLAVLAGQLESNTKYLSEIINNHYNVNFNTYINRLRINYIIEKLKTDPNFINYKISYLAENCGFSSHSSFATVFKSITGISPVKFIELLNQEKEDNLLENNG